MTKREVTEIFGVLMLAYPRAEMFKGGMERLDPTITLWTKMLDDVDFRIGQKAAVEIIKTSTFPPTIAEFRTAAKGETDKEENEVTHQWLSVRNALSYGNPGDRMALLSERAMTVVKSCGGIDVLDKLEGVGAYNAFTSKYREMLRGEKPGLLGPTVKQIGGR